MRKFECMSSNTQLFINGAWTDSLDGGTLPVVNPATGETIGTVSHAQHADLDLALDAASKGFQAWRQVSAYDRSKIMRKAADHLRTNLESIMRTMTTEQGKPLVEAKGEILLAADLIEWFAEESRRTYGRVIPPRLAGG